MDRLPPACPSAVSVLGLLWSRHGKASIPLVSSFQRVPDGGGGGGGEEEEEEGCVCVCVGGGGGVGIELREHVGFRFWFSLCDATAPSTLSVSVLTSLFYGQ